MTDPRVEVLPGRHLVACHGGVVVVVANRDDETATADTAAGAALLALRDLVDEAAAKEQKRTGRMFARLATTWLMGLDDEDAVEFGVLTPSAGGLAVFLHGRVSAVLAGADRSEVLRGSDAGFTVDRVVIPAPAIGAGLFVDEADQEFELPGIRGVCTLADGAVPGSGAVLWYGRPVPKVVVVKGDTPAARGGHDRRQTGDRSIAAQPTTEIDLQETLAPGAPVDDETAVPRLLTPELDRRAPEPVDGGHGRAVSRRDTGSEHTSSRPPSRPIDSERAASGPGREPDPAVPGGAGPRRVIVKGYKCARQHHNDPRVSFCAVCGIRMDQLTCVLTDGERPPLGLLLLDDGTSYILDADCVLGREPDHSEAARRGARPIRVDDASGGMSRTHAEIRLKDWDVTVVDSGSANGTHIRQPGHQDWIRALPGHPVILQPGAQILLGGRTATFDSQHGQL
ncbi:FHA domain-containing protein [Nocardia amikacinitolerans]|uniref:FHA domain-containing protein n=1 Tax=Nocardia amikacinitolerans TaxID=756689 RepID=UPI0020A56C03|nr:FHA domain-containing protein [Nocardia amikacinitolerans]MCP2289599.1 FHA domain-containing protein [Nocardia amikacinitolerans]